MHRCIVTTMLLLSLVLAAGWRVAWAAEPIDPDKGAEAARFFDKEVKPILQAECFRCHGAETKIKGGLRLTSRAALLKGGDSGPVINLEQPRESSLIKAIHHEEIKMPPKGKLPQAQIDILTRWVEMGVPWSTEPIKVERSGPPKVDDQARNFWSFRPPIRPGVSEVRNSSWVKNPIDAFVLAKLEAAGLEPAPPASKTTLLRRIYYDLIGLPPTPEEIDTFLADPAPDAYEKVIDRLLASRHYGEHWARHWLDLVRFAETNSFERDNAKPFAWRYRDYVIRAFNQDKPYGQFIREQIAGDELEPVQPDGIIATGYYRIGIWDDEPADRELAVYDELDDIAATTGQVFLGLTVNCARCHDHKIDPFPQKDYYRLLAFFRGIRPFGVRSSSSAPDSSLRTFATKEEQERQEALIAEFKPKLYKVEKEIAEFENMIRSKVSGQERDEFIHDGNRPRVVQKQVPKLITQTESDHYMALRKERTSLHAKRPSALALALCVTEAGKQPADTHVLARGNPQAKGEKIEPGFPSVLSTETPALPTLPADATTSGRRRVLADWLASPQNPLTARVMANRVWQYHFGRGIVRSSNNFGYLGTAPTHPELLDWLTTEFVAGGMKLKSMHRLIMTSNVYRMSSQGNAPSLAKDPENDLLWRFDMRRLTAEEVRDSILAVCGNLNLKKTEGPSVFPKIPQEVLAGQSAPGKGWEKSSPQDMASRSVFVHVKRSLLVPLLSVFDAADTDASCPVRFNTTQPAQALGLLNGEFNHEQAKIFADTVRKESGTDLAQRVRTILKRVCQRAPTTAEVERGVKYIAGEQKNGVAEDEALRRFCLLALNLNEFVYLD